jgi:amino acid permease
MERGFKKDKAMNKISDKDKKYRYARRFLHSAAVFSALFCVIHLLGFRQYTSILSGTASFSFIKNACGVIYLVLYIAVVVYVPILVIAAGLTKLMETAVAKHHSSHAPQS